MAAVTIVSGSIIALLGARFRWPSAVVLVATLGAFLLLGVPLAVPGQAISGVLPSVDGLLALVSGAGLGWKQLLTITLPVGTYQELLVPAFVLILIAAVVSHSVALRARFGELGVIAPAVLLLCGLALGPSQSPLAVPIVLAFLVIALGWLSWSRWYRRRESVRALVTKPALDEEIPAASERTGGLRTVGAAVLILAVAVTTGLSAVQLAPPEQERTVLRDGVEQPFDPRDYASPLSGFRRYHQPALADTTLMTVTGLAEGQRIRLAALDTYDGVVFSVGSEQVTSASGSFTRVPTTVEHAVIGGRPAAFTIDVLAYEGIWVPTVGLLERAEFEGAGAAALQDSFFYNDTGNTAVVVEGMGRGDRYELDALIAPSPPAGQYDALTPGAATVPAAVTVPEEITATLDRWTRDAETPGERLEAMLAGIATEGYISHGVGDDAEPSRSGHGVDRIRQLLTDPRMIGDEEQYAVTAALRARAIGFPSRVVFGFAPEVRDGASTAVIGSDVSAWIEVHTVRYGWVAVDPTPPEREIPEEEPEEPTQVARPQSPVPPPVVEPEPRQDQIPLDNDQDDEPAQDPLMAALLAALSIIGGSLLVILILLSPFLAVIGAKARRRSLRQRAPTPAERISGGWQEFEDTVIDYGLEPPPSPTRSEVAETVGGMQPLVLASVADRAVFAPERADEAEAIQVWTAVRELNAGLGEGRTRWQRIKAAISLRSLGGYRVKGLFTRERRLP